MSDFDWYATCAAVHASGSCEVVMAGEVNGTVHSSYPLGDDGNYKFWAYSDAYKATVTKDDGSEEEVDIYEAHNLSLLLSGQQDQIPDGQGVRVNGEKYMHVRVMKGETYTAKIADADGEEISYPVTMDEVHILRKGPNGLYIAVKGGYFFMCRTDNSIPEQAAPLALNGLAIGIYYAVGPDA